VGKVQLFLSREEHGLQIGRDDFASAEFDRPWRYERVRGRLDVMSPAGFRHHRCAKWIRNYLGAYELEHPDILADVFQESWVIVDETTDRLPDIAVYLASSTDTREFPWRIPDLIFEVVSPGALSRKRDYADKRSEYAQLRVAEYVIVDPEAEQFTVLLLDGTHYRESLLERGADYTTHLLPGLKIPVSAVFGGE